MSTLKLDQENTTTAEDIFEALEANIESFDNSARYSCALADVVCDGHPSADDLEAAALEYYLSYIAGSWDNVQVSIQRMNHDDSDGHKFTYATVHICGNMGDDLNAEAADFKSFSKDMDAYYGVKGAF